MAKAKKAGVDARMYRHFAAITVMLTAGIAVFSDGDGQESAQAKIIAKEQAARDAGKDVRKYGEAKLVNKLEGSNGVPRGGGGFDESVSDFGQPMDDAGGANDSSFLADMEAVPQHNRMAVPSGYNAQYGISEEELEKLTPEQRKKLLEQIKLARYGKSPEERREQIEKLKELSRERSGSPTQPGE